MVTGTYPNRLVLNVTGSVSNIEKVFQVTMNSYQHPTEPRRFYSPDREPSTAAIGVPVWHITGLDNFSIPRPVSLVRDAEVRGNTTGSGPERILSRQRYEICLLWRIYSYRFGPVCRSA